MLPDDSRLQAHLQAEPRTTRGSKGKPEPWREFWGWGQDRHLQAAIWDAVVGVAPRGKGSKAPTYPRPGKKQQGKSLLSTIPGRTGPTPDRG